MWHELSGRVGQLANQFGIWFADSELRRQLGKKTMRQVPGERWVVDDGSEPVARFLEEVDRLTMKSTSQ